MEDTVWKAAVSLALKGEFTASAMLTATIGEKPVWIVLDGGRAMAIRDRQ